MKKLFWCAVLFVCVSACREIFEIEDISTQKITVLAPQHASVLKDSIVTFTWDSLEGAEQYKLQVATPDFERATQIVVDSIIVATRLRDTLKLGNYEWRVRAENFGFNTAYTTQTFTIEK